MIYQGAFRIKTTLTVAQAMIQTTTAIPAMIIAVTASLLVLGFFSISDIRTSCYDFNIQYIASFVTVPDITAATGDEPDRATKSFLQELLKLASRQRGRWL
jgi:hypothetical protein